MIVLDTHIWVWWIHGDSSLSPSTAKFIESNEETGIVVSVISCWEVSKLVAAGRIQLSVPVSEWFGLALAYPGIRLIDLSPEICVESTQLPGEFHRDPADQIIVATARKLDAPLVTVDRKILKYPHVKLAG